MAGNREGGLKADLKIRFYLGEEKAHAFRQHIGALGGTVSSNSDWCLANREHMSEIGRRGGAKSRKRRKEVVN